MQNGEVFLKPHCVKFANPAGKTLFSTRGVAFFLSTSTQLCPLTLTRHWHSQSGLDGPGAPDRSGLGPDRRRRRDLDAPGVPAPSPRLQACVQRPWTRTPSTTRAAVRCTEVQTDYTYQPRTLQSKFTPDNALTYQPQTRKKRFAQGTFKTDRDARTKKTRQGSSQAKVQTSARTCAARAEQKCG